MQGIYFPPWYAGACVCHPVGFCFIKAVSPFINVTPLICSTNVAEYGSSAERVVRRCKMQTFHLFAKYSRPKGHSAQAVRNNVLKQVNSAVYVNFVS